MKRPSFDKRFMDTYRVAPGGQTPEQWCVVPVKHGKDAPASVSGFETREAAEKGCARLNELHAVWEAGEAGRRDEVLARMMGRPGPRG